MRHIPGSLLIAWFATTGIAIAQDTQTEKAQADNTVKAVGFSSQCLISTDFKGFYFNMVGGQIRFVHNHFAASIAIMPTLRFHKDEHLDPDDDVRPYITPTFSVGALFMYRRMMIATPISYSYDSKWHPTIGFGYKFGK